MQRTLRSGISDDLRQSVIATAHAAADAARAPALAHFRRAIPAEDKGGGAGYDPVTEGDRATERAIRAVIAARRPQDAIRGEEFAARDGRSGLTWVIDPIDGTRGYLSGTPTWGVLIAASLEDGPLFGIIDQPYIGERFAGGLGVAEVSGPQGRAPLATRGPRPLSEAILFSTFPEVGSAEERRAFERVAARARLVRYGMDCYGYALVALGQVDLVIEAGLHPYDVHAPIAVIEAAGGVVTDWQGGPAQDGGRILAAANPAIHAEALALLGRDG